MLNETMLFKDLLYYKVKDNCIISLKGKDVRTFLLHSMGIQPPVKCKIHSDKEGAKRRDFIKGLPGRVWAPQEN